MPSEEELIAQRLEKRERLLAVGNPYPATVSRTHDASQAVSLLEQSELDGLQETKPVTVAGRIIAQRRMGKAAFLDLSDGSGGIQLHVQSDVLGERFELLSLLDLGDFVEANGAVFRTRSGEATIAVRDWRIISKALRPMPEKWHGVTDVETRYRQRYLDLMANERSREVARSASQVVSVVRRFFERRGFLETVTPALQDHAGGAAARPFITHHNALDRDLYLRISLELHLKRLLVGGFDRVFEIGRVFRNEGISTRHNPEFLLLESYEAYADYRDVARMVEELLREVALEVAGSLKLPYGEHTIDLESPFDATTYREALLKHADFDYLEQRDAADLRILAEQRGVEMDVGISWDAALDGLWSALVEPHLIQPTFVFDYPIEMSPLAKRQSEDSRVVERFELFVAGHELANSYSELNDPVEQRDRMSQQAAKAASGDEEVDLADEDFLLALEHGMPPAGGLGMGLERLTQLMTGERSIREVILFPTLRQQSGEVGTEVSEED